VIYVTEHRDALLRRDGLLMPESVTNLAVLGGDPSIGRALELLLGGVGYDVCFLPHTVGEDLGELLDGVHLVLLAPALGPDAREALLSGVRRTPNLATLPVAALMSDLDEAPRGDGLAAYIPWPCRTAELSREIEDVLSRDDSRAV
jgi:hypothetical protein